MNVGFAGTPAFAAEVLASLYDAGFAVSLVLTQPDRPRGRGQKLQPSPVKQLASQHGTELLQPATLKSDAERSTLFRYALDVLVVAAYGLILPRSVLDWPRYGCINVHASLLPRWRGAAPIHRALVAGDHETGATIMQMDEGLDTGPILATTCVPIGPHDTTGIIEKALAKEGASALIDVLKRLERGEAVARVPQPADGATYAAKIDKSEASIDWRADAANIDRQVRAFNPAPGAATVLDGEAVKVWRAAIAEPERRREDPGTVLSVDAIGVVVACGAGFLRVEEVQPAGGRRMSAASFASGRKLGPGARFDVHAI